MTLRSLERGGAGVTMGAYLSVMQVLGIEQDLNLLGKSDPYGRELQDSLLPGRTKLKKPSQVSALATPATSNLPNALAVTAAELQPLTKNSSPEKMRQLLGSMPSEKIYRLIEALPETLVRTALAAVSSDHMLESLEHQAPPPPTWQ